MVRNVKFNTAKLAQNLGVSEVVAKLLVNRGIYNLDIANFLLILATIFCVISGVQYYVMNKELIFENDKKAENK